METIVYERPREKLRLHGVQFLTLTELIQLVIGSGTARVSGAKLARQVQELVRKGSISYDALVQIFGLGDAKACQLIGAIEFGRRVASTPTAATGATLQQQMAVFLKDAQFQKKATLRCYWLNGAGVEIDSKVYEPKKGEHYSLVVKRMFADALAVSARSVVIVIITSSPALIPNANELGVIKASHETAGVLGMRLIDVFGVYKQNITSWGGNV
jgi:DNA repair protein RadC